MTVRELHAVEVLDSRARPTLAVTLGTDGGVNVRAGVPAGASTGSREAVELCTNPAIITEAISRKVANASLIKVNQIGTVTETLDAMRVCREAGYAQFVSPRSAETEDAFVADLAVGTGCGHMKSGAPARGERVAKYNRLIAIEDAEHLPYGLGAVRS